MYLKSSKDANWWVLTLPAVLGCDNILEKYVFLSLAVAAITLAIVAWIFSPGGAAWANGRNRRGHVAIPGPRGLPFVGSLFTLSRGLAHRTLASMAWRRRAASLMAFSLGSNTPVVVSSDPHTAREILSSPHFADRPIKMSARSLMFSRAIGFAPNGSYWRQLRRIASTHLFSPRRIVSHECIRQAEFSKMLDSIAEDQSRNGSVTLRRHLQMASLNNIMGSVFGKVYDPINNSAELEELQDMVAEGFDLLGAFNWSDYLPCLSAFYDPYRIQERCAKLVPRVRKFVKKIIDEHRSNRLLNAQHGCEDFVDVLLSLEGREKLADDDIIAVLWEMIFRGTDTTALLTEWVMAELILHPNVQGTLRKEIDEAAKTSQALTDADVAGFRYLQAVVKESLRVHPPGPLLSWARLSTSDVQLSNGMVIPAGTTAMVNMWAITHDERVWENANEFMPERFLEHDVDIKGGDLRLAPFGAGRRVCPGKNLGIATVSLAVAKLVSRYEWNQDPLCTVDLSEVLKLSCEMKHPLRAVLVDRES